MVVLSALAAVQVVAKAQYDVAVSQADQLERSGNYTDEVSLLETYVNSNPMEKYQEPAAVKAASVASAHKNYRAAYRMYVKAWVLEGQNPKLETVVGVAQSAAFIGDKSSARSFYEQAINLLDGKSDDASVSKRNDYQNALTSLGGKP